ncbi:MAG: phosphoserine phosphatase [Syntrophus sp. (in: bacteria)]|nr:phosphoserine phosphatase [Syntrophus sp. (in: bacteria)]
MPIKVVFLDCDGTLTKITSSWEYLHRRLDLWTANADAYQTLFQEGKIDYYEFCRRDALLWRGLPVSRINEIVNEIPYRDGVAEAIALLKKLGVFTVIISSGLSFLVNRVREDLSIDMAISNELTSQAGLLTGGVKINVEYNQKDCIVRNILRDLGFEKKESSAVGDGDGDRGMFDEVGLPIGLCLGGESCSCHEGTTRAGTFADVVEIIRRL